MSRPSTLEAAAAAAYARGADPLAFTEDILGLLAECVFGADVNDPNVTLFSRRALAALMDLGWRMPNTKQAG